MQPQTFVLLFTVFIATPLLPATGWASFESLDLERSCGQCHDVAHPGTLSDEHWLQRLQELGPIEKLSTQQRTEIAGFLRYHGWEVNQIVTLTGERHLFEQKCGLCHAVERVFVRDLSKEQLHDTVVRMRARAPQWISEDDVQRIVAFLDAGARGVPRPQHRVADGGPAEVFLERCAACHPLERAYLYLETELEPHWPLLVKRMQAKAPDWISNAEAQQIVDYLSALQPLLRQPLQPRQAP